MRNRWWFWMLLGAIVAVVCYTAGFYFTSRSMSRRGVIQPLIFRSKLGRVTDLVKSYYVDSISYNEIEDAALEKLMSQLDPHSEYIPASLMKRVSEPLRGDFEGIGITFNMLSDTLVVVSTIHGGPSERAGILAGDRIVKVDGKIVAGVKFPQDSLMMALRGPRGTPVHITLERHGVSDPLEFTVTRDRIPIRSVEVAYMLDSITGYIHLVRFALTTPQEFSEAMLDLSTQGMQQLVLDLRGNGGGLLDAAFYITGLFLPRGKMIVYTEGRNRPREDMVNPSDGLFRNIPLAVMIDEYSASASEIFSGAIQDNDRGFIVGRRSFGKGLVQEQFRFTDSSAIRLTVARYYTPSGRCIQRPYELGNDSSYYFDMYKRLEHGELLNVDSVSQDTLQRFYTAGGRPVYAGGGIMPDIFVPVDTVANSQYAIQIFRRSLLLRYAIRYLDDHRQELSACANPAALSLYLDKHDALNQFIRFVSKEGVVFNPKQFEASRELLKAHLYGLISRGIWDNNGYYYFINPVDPAIQESQKALYTRKVL